MDNDIVLQFTKKDLKVKRNIKNLNVSYHIYEKLPLFCWQYQQANLESRWVEIKKNFIIYCFIVSFRAKYFT